MRALVYASLTLLALSNCTAARPVATEPSGNNVAAAPSAMVAPSAFYRFPVTAKASGVRPPPMMLTASDGTGLKLTAISARAVVEAPLAFTEMRLSFENPLDRTLEGNFSITLPPGATVSRFAMKLGDSWQEGEVVELQRARHAYEDFLHRKQDPALLEQGAGNEFTARVFPIPARGIKELIVAYSQELEPNAPYAIHLRGLPEVGQLDMAVNLPGTPLPLQELNRTRFVPTSDFVLEPQYIPQRAGLRSGNLVLARVRPTAESQPEPLSSVVILMDTSASRALGWADQVRLLAELVQKVVEISGPKAQLTVACFDQTTEPIFQGDAGRFGEQEILAIQERQALGASNLGQALVFAQRHAKATHAKRVILITDGVATAGENEADKLLAATANLKLAGVERVDAISVGGIRDDATLHLLVASGLPHAGVVADGTLGMAAIGHKLSETTRSGIAVNVEGASWSWPQKLDGVQAGDEVLVYADLPEGRPVKITLGGTAVSVPELTHVERPILERAWVQAKIASLVSSQNTDGSSPEIKKQIVDLSIAHRVLSPYTALLVLETENDYARFGIDRRSLTDILTVEAGHIAVKRRQWTAPVKVAGPSAPNPIDFPKNDPGPPTAPWGADSVTNNGDPNSARGNMWGDSAGDAFGSGGLGLSGVGEGGGGRGEGIGLGNVGTLGHGAGTSSGSSGSGSSGPGSSGSGSLGAVQRLGASHAVQAPTLRAGATQVSGRLPPEVIMRIVRQNFGRFRLCYENGLRQNASLEGRIAIRFTIDRGGSVSTSADAGSDLPNAAVVACVARAFTNLSFPQPEGGTVTVIYPIAFSPGGGGAAPQVIQAPSRPPTPSEEIAQHPEPYTGHFKSVMEAIAEGRAKAAIQTAFTWHSEEPGDVMALVALGASFEAASELPSAARAYGSIIDLFSSRADLRRFAGERLEHVRGGAGLDLALDTYAKAVAQRADHPSSHRLLAFALLKKGDYEKAFEAGMTGVHQGYPVNRFAGVDRILREDLGLLGAAWIKAEPSRTKEILTRIKDAGGKVEDGPSLRFVLNWETDANDVDFHIFDATGGHAFFNSPHLASGGDLYADVTTGYGPECFTIRGPKENRSALYTLQAHYYSRGPMGYGMGKVEVIDHDGKGGITFDERPFVAMVDQAFVDLGTLQR